MRVGLKTAASHGRPTREPCMIGILKGTRHAEESYRCTWTLIPLFKYMLDSCGNSQHSLIVVYCNFPNTINIFEWFLPPPLFFTLIGNTETLPKCILCRLSDFDAIFQDGANHKCLHSSTFIVFVTLDQSFQIGSRGVTLNRACEVYRDVNWRVFTLSTLFQSLWASSACFCQENLCCVEIADGSSWYYCAHM